MTKKIRQYVFFANLFVVVFGSGIRDGQKSGSGINIPDPQHGIFFVLPVLILNYFSLADPGPHFIRGLFGRTVKSSYFKYYKVHPKETKNNA